MTIISNTEHIATVKQVNYLHLKAFHHKHNSQSITTINNKTITMCCCHSPEARARREVRRAKKIAFAKKVYQNVTGKAFDQTFMGQRMLENQDSRYAEMESGKEERPQMYARSLRETQPPSYDEIVDGEKANAVVKEKN